MVSLGTWVAAGSNSSTSTLEDFQIGNVTGRTSNKKAPTQLFIEYWYPSPDGFFGNLGGGWFQLVDFHARRFSDRKCNRSHFQQEGPHPAFHRVLVSQSRWFLWEPGWRLVPTRRLPR